MSFYPTPSIPQEYMIGITAVEVAEVPADVGTGTLTNTGQYPVWYGTTDMVTPSTGTILYPGAANFVTLSAGDNYWCIGQTSEPTWVQVAIWSAVEGSGGTPGPQGAAGSQGAQGGAGPQGAAGTQGAAGAQGTAGTPGGPTGATGATGGTGAQGAAGSNGSNGAQGAQGAQGSQGSGGAQGSQGSQGSQGHQGFQGTAAQANNPTQETLGSSTITVDPTGATYGNGDAVQNILLTSADSPFTMAAAAWPTSGTVDTVELRLLQDGTGGATIAGWWSKAVFSNGIGVTLSPAANDMTVVLVRQIKATSSGGVGATNPTCIISVTDTVPGYTGQF